MTKNIKKDVTREKQRKRRNNIKNEITHVTKRLFLSNFEPELHAAGELLTDSRLFTS